MRCDEILNIQAMGLKKRMDHIHCHKATVGLSGGLDSTLALLVIARAFDLSGADRKDIHCITMPCFGTTVPSTRTRLSFETALPRRSSCRWR